MQLDQFTYNDLSIFQAEEEFSVFHRLNFTRTSGGTEWLKKYFREPFSELERIYNRQASIKLITQQAGSMADCYFQWYHPGAGKIPGLQS